MEQISLANYIFARKEGAKGNAASKSAAREVISRTLKDLLKPRQFINGSTSAKLSSNKYFAMTHI